jgi:hypothetical protein
VRREGRKRCGNHGLCDLCRHEESILGRKLCLVCLEAIARLAYAVGVRASPFLIGSGGGCGELPERKEEIVRTHIGDYAYDVRKELCAETEAFAHWAYMVYKVTPIEELLSHGEDSPSQEHAERNARQLIALHIEIDRIRSSELSGSNNARM